MLFRESFITDAGSTLLARAAAGNGAIVWTRAATSNADTDSDSTADMNRMTDITKSVSDSYTSSGAVTNALVNDARTSVSIYAELTNETYSGAACTFGAWAKIQGDANDVLVIVARCGGATPTTINPASEGVVKAFVDFTLQISAEQAQAVAVGEGYYATAAALEDEQDAREALAGRVVTTHSAGDETAGDAQTILGAKTFAGDVRVNKLNVGTGVEINSNTVYSMYFVGPTYYVKGSNGVSNPIIHKNTTDPENATAIIEDCKINAYSVTTGEASITGNATIGGNITCGTSESPKQIQTIGSTATVTIKGDSLTWVYNSNVTRIRIGITPEGIQCKDSSGTNTVSINGGTGAVSAVTLNGLLSSLYDTNNGVGALAQIYLINPGASTARSLSRGTVVYDGIVVSGDTITATIDGEPLVGDWAILNRAGVGASGIFVLAVRVA